MVRLTADLILRSPQYFNAVREREIDLRGNKIAAVENLGATEDQYDSIDISDNEIVKLENFPYLKRLTTLLVNNNRIARISPSLGAALPKLETLVLTNNRLVNLVDLDPLGMLVNLQTLCLLDNLVTKKPQYRFYLINKLPKLRLLDFKKVKLKERQEANRQFGMPEKENAAPSPPPAKTFVPGEVVVEASPVQPEEPSSKGPTPQQILAIKAAIANSQTLEEVARLEKALKSGELLADLKQIRNEEVQISPPEINGPEPETAEESNEASSMLEG